MNHFGSRGNSNSPNSKRQSKYPEMNSLSLNYRRLSGGLTKVSAPQELVTLVPLVPKGVISLTSGRRNIWLPVVPINLSKLMLASRLLQYLKNTP